MRLDRTHMGWMLGSVFYTAAATVVYVVYSITTPGGPKGDTWVGLAYGLIGFFLILFAGLLGARKKIVLARVGSLSWWMRGHLWLGMLSLPMILFHAAFAFGGPLTTVLMTLLFIIVISGIAGALLQHAIPGVMTAQVTEETTVEQIDRMFANLRREAFEVVWTACGDAPEADGERDAIKELIGDAPKKPKPANVIKFGEAEGQDQLQRFYRNTILPYLRKPRVIGSALASSTGATLTFDTVVVGLDPKLHEAVSCLAEICDETRQKVRQMHLHNILHGWLLLHIPLSMALMVLMVVHAVMALYY